MAQLSDLPFSLAGREEGGGAKRKEPRRMDKYTEPFILTSFVRPAKIVAVN